MAVTMADVEALIAAAVRAALAEGGRGGGADGGGRGGGGRLDERHYRRVEKLAGPNWKEFAFQFKTATGAANGRVREVLDEIVKAGKEPDYDLIFGGLQSWEDADTVKYGAELYAALSSLVT